MFIRTYSPYGSSLCLFPAVPLDLAIFSAFKKLWKKKYNWDLRELKQNFINVLFPNKNVEAPSEALFSFHLCSFFFFSFYFQNNKKKKISRRGLPPSGCVVNGPCFQDSPMLFTSNNFNAPKISVALHESLETRGKKKKNLWNMVWSNVFFHSWDMERRACVLYMIFFS